MSDQTSKLTVTHEDAVAAIALNRPACLNAIDLDLAIDLEEALETVADDPGVRAVIITGSGRAFCSGGGLKLALSVSLVRPGEAFLKLTRHPHAWVRLLQDMHKPTLAAISGPAASANTAQRLECLHAFVEKRSPEYRATIDQVTADALSKPVGHPAGAATEGERC